MDLRLAELPPRERYKLLIGLVIPRPIAWISTRSANGVAPPEVDVHVCPPRHGGGFLRASCH